QRQRASCSARACDISEHGSHRTGRRVHVCYQKVDVSLSLCEKGHCKAPVTKTWTFCFQFVKRSATAHLSTGVRRFFYFVNDDQTSDSGMSVTAAGSHNRNGSVTDC